MLRTVSTSKGLPVAIAIAAAALGFDDTAELATFSDLMATSDLDGFLLTGTFMHLFTRWLALPYLPAQVVTTGIVLVWSFLANKAWTFRGS